MKKLLFAMCFLFGTAVAVNAQDTTSTTTPTDPTVATQVEQDQDGRVKIKSQDLPDAVKKSLESQEYRGWLVNAAYKVEASANAGDASSTTPTTTPTTEETGANAKELYIIELKNGAQTKTVRFDKDGKKLDDQDMKDDQK